MSDDTQEILEMTDWEVKSLTLHEEHAARDRQRLKQMPTLRQQYATAALQGIVAREAVSPAEWNAAAQAKTWAKQAFTIADAMIAAEKP